MKLLNILPLYFMILLSVGCSFTKSESIKPKKINTLYNKISTENKATPESILLSEFHNIQELEIKKNLNKNPEKTIPIPVYSERFKEYSVVFDSIFKKIGDNNLVDAIAEVSTKNFACEDLELSLIYTYMAKDLKNFEPFESFLRKIHCAKAPPNKIHQLYNLEAVRQFHQKFSDLTLLKYLIHHSNFVRSTMIPMSNSGVSISLVLLYKISRICFFNQESMGKKYDDGYSIDFVGCDRTLPEETANSDLNLDAVEIPFFNVLKYQREEFDITYVKEGRLIGAFSTYEIPRNEALDQFPAQITMFMHGFWDEPDKWKWSVDDLLKADPMEWM